jgi:hypothetical protein
MRRWAIEQLKRDSFICGIWSLALNSPDPIKNRSSILIITAVSLVYVSVVRLFHFGYVALASGGVLRPVRGSLVAVVLLLCLALYAWIVTLQFGENEGTAVILELLWCVFPPTFVIFGWNWQQERQVRKHQQSGSDQFKPRVPT